MKSMLFKLWTGMMSLVVIVLILLWLFQIVFLQSFYTNMRISNVKKDAALLVKSGGDLVKSGFGDALDAFAFRSNLSIELLDSMGNLKYVTESTGNSMQMPMMKNSVRVEAFNEAILGNTVSIPFSHPRFGNKFMIIGIPVKTNGVVTNVLIIDMPMAAVEETASILKWQLFYITIILFAAAIIISYLISKSFTRPILEIKRASEKMASGDFSVRIGAKKQDEIGKLADSINYMAVQLSKIEQLRKDLIANVSHELRTPLSLIRGYAETIRDVSGDNPEKRDRQLGIVIEETERLSKIVDDILNLSQLQSGNIRLNMGQVSVKNTLDDIIKRYDVLSEKTGVNILRQGITDALIEADEDKIKQVFYNLINNAFNHTPNGGTITVRAFELQEAVRMEISDTGRGIPEDELPHIWDRYYKADKTMGKMSVGTGLGLAIVREVLNAHNALYGVNSKINKGTTFWIEMRKCS